MQFRESLKVNFIIFILLYSFLFTFWWLVSFAYMYLIEGKLGEKRWKVK